MTRIGFWVLPALVFLASWSGHAAQPADSGYKVLKRIPIGGAGGWDYLTMDAAARRLYIARSNRVQVVDIEEGKLVGEVLDTPGVHGVALDTKRQQGFTSNGGDASVTIFDLKTLKETGRVKVGTGPDSILYDPASDQVFTLNARSNDATALSAATARWSARSSWKAVPKPGWPTRRGWSTSTWWTRARLSPSMRTSSR